MHSCVKVVRAVDAGLLQGCCCCHTSCSCLILAAVLRGVSVSWKDTKHTIKRVRTSVPAVIAMNFFLSCGTDVCQILLLTARH
jgi:hypothetical protein